MLDPDIRRFVDTVTGIYERYPNRSELPVAEARAIAEEARLHWAKDGPTMHSTDEAAIPAGAGSVRLRIHRPAAADDRKVPALIYLHGGGWTLFSLDTHDRLMREYAARAGVAVIGVDYPLSPETKFPGAVHGVAAVVEWLLAEGEALGIDTHLLAIGGDSAGANLAVAACLVLRDSGKENAISAMVLNYGVFDADLTRPSYARFGDGGYLLTKQDMVWFWGNYARDDADRGDPLARVLGADLRHLPQAFMAIAEYDVLLDENMEMAQRLRDAGVKVVAIVYPGTVHSFLEAISIASVSDQAFNDAADWLRRLRPQEP